MSNWRPVDVRLWNDRKFLACSDGARLLWLFLLTCPSLPIPGVVVGGDAALAELLGWTPERLRERFAEIARNGLRVRREARIVWLPNALKYQPPANPNMVKSWGKKWDDVPEGELKVELWEALRIACKSWSVLFGKLFPKPFVEGSWNGSANGLGNGSAHEHQHNHEHQHDHDLEEEDLSPSRAIPPAVPQPEPAPVPAMSQPAPAREDIARTQPEPKYAREPVADSAFGPRPCDPVVSQATRNTPENMRGVAPVGDRDPKPENAIQPGEPSLDQLWTELEQARQRAAAARGVAIPPLVAHDAGRGRLAEDLAEASRVGKRADLVAQIRHAIAAAEAESRVAPEPGKPDRLQWFTGAVFSPNNFRRLAAAPLPKARSAHANANRRREADAKGASADPVRSPEDMAAMLALAAAAAAAPESGREIASLDTAELVKRFGDPEARAGPSSAAPTDHDPDEKPRRKAAK